MGLYGAFIAAAELALTGGWTEAEKKYLLNIYQICCEPFLFEDKTVDDGLGAVADHRLKELINYCKRAKEKGADLVNLSVQEGLRRLAYFQASSEGEQIKRYMISRKHFISLSDKVRWTPQMFPTDPVNFRFSRVMPPMAAIAKAANELLVFDQICIDPSKAVPLESQNLYKVLADAVQNILVSGKGDISLPVEQCYVFIELIKSLLNDCENAPPKDLGCKKCLKWAFRFLNERMKEAVPRAIEKIAVEQILRQLERVKCTLDRESHKPEDIEASLNATYFNCLAAYDSARPAAPLMIYRFTHKDQNIAHQQIELFICLLDKIANTAKALFRLLNTSASMTDENFVAARRPFLC